MLYHEDIALQSSGILPKYSVVLPAMEHHWFGDLVGK